MSRFLGVCLWTTESGGTFNRFHVHPSMVASGDVWNHSFCYTGTVLYENVGKVGTKMSFKVS